MSGVEALRPEWERISLLAGIAHSLRRGETIASELRERLATSQAAVRELRAGAAWTELCTRLGLEPIDQDILICTLAPDAEPSLGWRFNELQGGSGATYPSPALIHELLALDEPAAAMLRGHLDPAAPLRRQGLIEASEGGTAFESLRPTARARSLVLGWEQDSGAAPPGSTEITIPAGLGLDALIVPAHHKQALREFVAWVRFRDRVVAEWGAPPSGGPVALMAGPSGTGKTFAATVIASMLGWRLYRVDLGLLVSKWLGETEKNINRLFDAATGRPLILLFDEADALFGKRGQVRDARDRYANMEVSHLLSRLERHDGPAILTTNLREYLDPAFARRLHLVLEFPAPDVEARAQLWSRYLPPGAPLAPDVDVQLLASAMRLTGAQIRNICLYAAVLAMSAGAPLGLAELTRAAWIELGKDGKEQLSSRLGPLATHIPREELR